MRALSQSVAIALLVCCAAGCVPVGQRLLKIEIEHDGQVEFEAMRGVPDNTLPEDMWNILDDVSFESTTGNESPAQLSGDIVVRIKHVDRELTNARLNNLALEPNADGETWSISSGEAERIRAAASN